jgi:ribonuclease HI
MNHLARNKAPGPDGIPNELLQALPETLQGAIHTLMVIMWVKAEVPDQWTASDTVLLPKKGDALLIKNKRPIALANTLYKLYTSLITLNTVLFSELANVFTEAQEGYLRQRNTERQIHSVLHAIEDAALTGRDLMMLYVDFTSAFNTIDQDKLLMILYDLGYPTDLIEVIANLYSKASTSIRTEHGRTPPIAIERGTVQGDTLSPILFIIFMEPLLRWLHCGGRGYRYGCLKPEENDRHQFSSGAFADDLVVLTNNVSDMRMQTEKLERYSRWGGLKVNVQKCQLQGILHGRARSDKDLQGGPTTGKYQAAVARMLEKQIRIDNEPIPYEPPTGSYKYLGVHITPTLDWGDQVAYARAEIRRRGRKIAESLASPDQKLNMVRTLLQPFVAYSLSVMAYTPQDIAGLDALIAGVAKRCYGLKLGFPNRAILAPADRMGLGIGTIRTLYVAKAAKALVQSLNDEGRLGVVTRSMLHLQSYYAGECAVHKVGRDSRFFTTLKQLALLREAGIALTDHGAFYHPQGSDIQRLLKEMDTSGAHDNPNLPFRYIQPLLELGCDLRLLRDRNTGKHLIDTTQLERLFASRVRRRHKLALNRLSLALSPDPDTRAQAKRYNKVTPLQLDSRLLPEVSDLTGLARSSPIPCPVAPDAIVRYLSARPGEAPKDTAPAGTVAGTPNTEPDTGTGTGGTQQPRPQRKHKTPRTLQDRQRESIRKAKLKPFEDIADVNWNVGWDPAATPLTLQHCEDAASGLNLGGQLQNATALLDMLHGRKEWPARLSDRVRFNLLQALFGNQEKIARIIARVVQRVRADAPPTKKQRPEGPRDTHRTYYEVAWEPTIIPKGALSLYASQHYHPREVQPYTALGNQAAETHLVVDWAPTREESSRIECEPNWCTLLAEFEARREQGLEQEPGRTNPAQDRHLTEAQRQGRWQTETLHTTRGQRLLRQHVTIDTQPRNPDLDIHPTGKYEIQVGRHTRLPGTQAVEWTPDEPAPLDLLDTALAFVYDPCGRCLGQVDQRRLRSLWLRYQHAKATNPAEHAQLVSTGGFAEDVARLLLRYKDGGGTKSYPIRAMHERLLNPEAVQRIMGSMQTCTERFASPLNVADHTAIYYTPFSDDALFGANRDAYSQPFTGLSVAHPDPTPEAGHHAIRWALGWAEAQQGKTEPTATLLILPHSRTAPYTRYLYSQHVVHVGTIAANTRLNTLQHAAPPRGDVSNTTGYREGTDLILVGNEAGLQRAAALRNALELPDTPTPLIPQERGPRSTQHTKWVRRRIHSLQQQPPTPARCSRTCIGTDLTEHERREAFLVFAASRPLRHEADLDIYTDGSVQTVKREDGAEMRGLGAAAVDARSRTTCHINVNAGNTGCQTITRCELSAIHQALRMRAGTDAESLPLTIWTDSAASLFLIRKMINQPHMLNVSKHKALLENIVTLLKRRASQGQKTALLKVKAHSGVSHNEAADRAAVKAAQMSVDPAAQWDACEDSDNDPRKHYYWVQKAGDGEDSGYYANDLNRGLHKLASPEVHLGYSNETQYTGYMAATLPLLDIKVSARTLQRRTGRHKRLKRCFDYLYGQLWNAKLAQRFGRTINGRRTTGHADGGQDPGSAPCPICPRADSGNHILGGCQHPHMHAMYIKRHNTAVCHIARHLSKGRHGGCYMIMDATSQINLPDYVANSRLPQWLLPNTAPDALSKMRPDLLVIPDLPLHLTQMAGYEGPQGKDRYTVHIIEVGYTADTNHEAKRHEKLEQHRQLAAALRDAGWNVKYTDMDAISLGFGGTIRKDLRPLLVSLGVASRDALRCCHELHDHAVSMLNDIVYARRQLERRRFAPSDNPAGT